MPETALRPFLKETPNSTPAFSSTSLLGKIISVGAMVPNLFSVVKAVRTTTLFDGTETVGRFSFSFLLPPNLVLYVALTFEGQTFAVPSHSPNQEGAHPYWCGRVSPAFVSFGRGRRLVPMPDAPSVHLSSFCLGGTQAIYAASDATLIDAAVIAHPGPIRGFLSPL